jgi:type IV secretion system protein TrbL
MKRYNHWLVVIGLLLVASPAFAEYDLGSIMDQYQTAATQFGQNITSVALKLCYMLFTIDLAWTVAGRVLRGSDTVEIGVAVIMRLMWVSLVVWIINNPSVPLAFVNGFVQLGKTGANTSAISPGDVFWQGIDLVNLMMSKFADNSTVMGVPVPAGISAMANPFAAFMIGAALIGIIVCFAMLAAQFAVAWIQLWFYLAVYPIVLAFGAMKWTRDIAMKVITTPLVYGVRFMAIYFIIAVGTTLAQSFGTEIGNLSLTNLTPIWTVLAGSVLMFMLTLKVPALGADLLSGTASLSVGDGASGAVASGGALAAIAGGAYAAGGVVANGVGGAIRAGQAAIAHAREKGAMGVMGTAAGAAGAIGSVAGEATMESIKGFGGESLGGRLAGRIDAKTASIREAKAAGSATPTVPGGQLPAPAAPPAQGSDSAPAAPEVAQIATTAGSDVPLEPTRATPAAPVAIAAPMSAVSAPQVYAPAATIGAAVSDAVTAPVAPTSGSAGPATAPSTSQQPPALSASSRAADAAKTVVDEVQKTSGSGGGTVQTHHGDES